MLLSPGISSILCMFILLLVLPTSSHEDGSNTAYCIYHLGINSLLNDSFNQRFDVFKDPKMDSCLAALCKDSTQCGSYDKLIADKDSNTLLVDIYLERGCTKIDELQSFIKEIRAARDDVIEAEIYKDKLIHIRDLPYVGYIGLPRIQNRNELISEAANCTKDIMGICPYRMQDIDGDGVVVAVLDSEFYRDASIKRELPEKTKVISSSPTLQGRYMVQHVLN